MAHEDMINMKIVIIGDGACGKSALLLTYISKEFPRDYIPTVVDNYDVVMALGDAQQKLKLSIVDTAGQEDFKSIRNLSYAGTHVVIFCYSCDNKASLDNVRTLWVPEIRAADPKTPFVLVGNKRDLVSKAKKGYVTMEDAEEVRKELRGYASLQCSAKEHHKGLGGDVDQVFKVAIKCGVEKLKLFQFQDDFCSSLLDKCTLL